MTEVSLNNVTVAGQTEGLLLEEISPLLGVFLEGFSHHLCIDAGIFLLRNPPLFIPHYDIPARGECLIARLDGDVNHLPASLLHYRHLTNMAGCDSHVLSLQVEDGYYLVLEVYRNLIRVSPVKNLGLYQFMSGILKDLQSPTLFLDECSSVDVLDDFPSPNQSSGLLVKEATISCLQILELLLTLICSQVNEDRTIVARVQPDTQPLSASTIGLLFPGPDHPGVFNPSLPEPLGPKRCSGLELGGHVHVVHKDARVLLYSLSLGRMGILKLSHKSFESFRANFDGHCINFLP